MKEFEIQIGSDIEYEKITAEIYYDKKFIALVDQEDGLESLKVMLADCQGVPLEKFIKSLEFAIKELRTGDHSL